MKFPLISIIIANYNGEKYLDVCLKSILKSVFPNCEILVVDDGSSDSSMAIIKNYQSKEKNIIVLSSEQNVGAATSRNKAIKKAKGEILVFLDNDTEVTRNWLEELIEPLLRDKSIGASQSLLLDFEKRDLIQMAGGLLIPHTGWLIPFFQWESYKKIKNTIKERNIVGISAALAVKREVIDTIGGFDEKEGIYTEDLDFCWRIWIAGYRIVLANKSIVYHYTKSVLDRAGMKATYRKIYFNLAKNSIRSIIKNYELVNILKYLPSTILVNFIRGFFVLVKRHDASALFGTFSAFVWNFSNLADTISCRLEIQKTRKLSDLILFSTIFENKGLTELYKQNFK